MTVTALLVALVAVCGSLAFAVIRAVALWRAYRALRGAFGVEMEAFGSKLDALTRHEPPQTEALGESVARLRQSTAQLSVLTTALGRVREQWAGLLAVYPRK